MSETKTCPICGKQAIRRRTGHAIMTYPEQYATEWWCGCGYREPAENQRGMTQEELARAQWEAANSQERDAQYIPPPGYRLCGHGCGLYTFKLGNQDERHRTPEGCASALLAHRRQAR